MSRISRSLRMPYATILAGLAAWGCGPDSSPTGPAAEPEAALASTTARYTVRNLGTLGGSHSSARDINDLGVVVGWSALPGNTRRRAFVWRAGSGMKDLGALAGGESDAAAINNDGVIVGSSRVASGDWRAVRWMNGVKRNLGTLGGRNSEATDINVFGHIVGWSETASGARHAFVWKNGVMTDLGTMGGRNSQATGINRGGAIVGWSQTASGETRAFRWKEGVFKNLGAADRVFSIATGINTLGQIVGYLGTWPDAVGEEEDAANPFIYHRETLTELPGWWFTTQAMAIGPTGLVVGWSLEMRDPFGTQDALLWENGVVQRLPELTNGSSGAYSVNRGGNIVGVSQTTAVDFRAVLWRRQ